jgi:hypothetical protein
LLSWSDTYFFRWVTVAARYANVPTRLRTFFGHFLVIERQRFAYLRNATYDRGWDNCGPDLRIEMFYWLGVSKPSRFALGRRGKASRLTEPGTKCLGSDAERPRPEGTVEVIVSAEWCEVKGFLGCFSPRRGCRLHRSPGFQLSTL